MRQPNHTEVEVRPIDSSYDRAATQAATAAQKALEAMQDGAVLGYDHPLIEALDDMAWGEIRDQIEEVPGEGWRLAVYDETGFWPVEEEEETP